MKTYQSVLPGAIRKDCRGSQIAAQLRARLTEVFANGFWFCLDHEGKCERVEDDHGQPPHCDQCGSHRIKWNAPIWSALIPDEKMIQPGEL